MSQRLGTTAETLRSWIRQGQADDGNRHGVTSATTAEPVPYASVAAI